MRCIAFSAAASCRSTALTETTGAVTFLPAEDHAPDSPRAYLLRSAGKALPGVELRIVDVAGKNAPEGEVGEDRGSAAGRT